MSQRRQWLRRQLEAKGSVGLTEAAAELGVSEQTIRRDLDLLAQSGLTIQKVRGGATYGVAPSRGYEPPFAQRSASSSAAKTAIGRAAAELVNPGDTVIIDVGTTALELARALCGMRDLTVVTASLPVANELGNDKGIRVIVTGGQVRSGELSLTGGMAEDAFKQWNCDLAFIGVAGVSPLGLTEYNPEDSRVKQAAIRAARRTVVLADVTKLGRVAFSTVAQLSEVTALVTDAAPGDASLEELSSTGIEVIHAHSHEDEDEEDERDEET